MLKDEGSPDKCDSFSCLKELLEVAFAIGIEYTENGFIYTHYNVVSELVMPGVIFQVFLLLGIPEVLR